MSPVVIVLRASPKDLSAEKEPFRVLVEQAAESLVLAVLAQERLAPPPLLSRATLPQKIEVM